MAGKRWVVEQFYELFGSSISSPSLAFGVIRTVLGARGG
jgi:hypothetical protein